jgi:hypothetical protein
VEETGTVKVEFDIDVDPKAVVTTSGADHTESQSILNARRPVFRRKNAGTL